MDHLGIIIEYKYKKVGCVRWDKHIRFCKDAPTLQDAIFRASMAIDEFGKKHSHQFRVPKNKLELLKKELFNNEAQIKGANDFDDLFNIIIQSKVFYREDSLTYYDTALRLGFYLNKLPQKIYLHAGTRKGAKKIICDTENNKFLIKNYLPEPFKSCDLTEYELEDLFCIYKDVL